MSNNIEEDVKKITDMINYIRFNSKPIYTMKEWFMAIEDIRLVIAGLQAKANKYDSLVEKIKDKKEWLEENILRNDYASDSDKDIAEYQVNILQELLDTEK